MLHLTTEHCRGLDDLKIQMWCFNSYCLFGCLIDGKTKINSFRLFTCCLICNSCNRDCKLHQMTVCLDRNTGLQLLSEIILQLWVIIILTIIFGWLQQKHLYTLHTHTHKYIRVAFDKGHFCPWRFFDGMLLCMYGGEIESRRCCKEMWFLFLVPVWSELGISSYME